MLAWHVQCALSSVLSAGVGSRGETRKKNQQQKTKKQNWYRAQMESLRCRLEVETTKARSLVGCQAQEQKSKLTGKIKMLLMEKK